MKHKEVLCVLLFFLVCVPVVTPSPHCTCSLTLSVSVCQVQHLPWVGCSTRLKERQEANKTGPLDSHGSPVVRNPRFQCRGCRLDPWLGN